MASENGQEKCETLADIVREKRSMAAEIRANLSNVPVRRDDQLLEADSLDREADRIEAAAKLEIDEIVSAVSELREGMCLHCALQDQCADGEDGMPTTCNAMAKVNNFINRYKKVEARDECPF